MYAAKHSDVNCVRILLAAGASITTLDNNGYSVRGHVVGDNRQSILDMLDEVHLPQ